MPGFTELLGWSRKCIHQPLSRANFRPGEQAVRLMVTPSNSLFTSRPRAKALGVLVAGGILFAIGFGGPGALWGASTGATAEVTSSS